MAIIATVTTAQQEFPPGTIAGGWRFLVTQLAVDGIGGAVVHDKIVATSTYELPVTIPANYSVSVARVSSVGSQLGPQKSANFSIVAPANVMIAVAGSIIVTVS